MADLGGEEPLDCARPVADDHLGYDGLFFIHCLSDRALSTRHREFPIGSSANRVFVQAGPDVRLSVTSTTFKSSSTVSESVS